MRDCKDRGDGCRESVARKRKKVFVGGLEVEGSGWPPFAVAEGARKQVKMEGATLAHSVAFT